MEKAKIEDVTFDEEDVKLLMLKSDLLLKAKGIQYSILPKLNVILEEALSRVRRIYGVEVFDNHSTVCSAPAFREHRKNEMKRDYNYGMVGITGTGKLIWHGFTKKDGRPVRWVPFRLAIFLTKNGLSIAFQSPIYLTITDESHAKVIVFLEKNIQYIQTIQSLSRMDPVLLYEAESAIVEFNEYLKKMKAAKFYKLPFIRNIRYPIGTYEINAIINSFVVFFPVYDSMIKIAKGERDNFRQLISMVKCGDILGYNRDLEMTENKIIDIDESEILNKRLDEKNVVKVGIRWQVFERDNFKCVACGASAKDGAILHVDHIIPRSKGGKDEIGNYQTLCHKCNIGKSNKSQIDLR